MDFSKAPTRSSMQHLKKLVYVDYLTVGLGLEEISDLTLIIMDHSEGLRTKI
jgi:hypothetical protein